mmetsp:Transcript_33825/g.76566  ORF Transcript_33825/g.76566 Transcript_33825/m.76566 type:complete len:342 (+) Transcript_33825:106-1131(+)
MPADICLELLLGVGTSAPASKHGALVWKTLPPQVLHFAFGKDLHEVLCGDEAVVVAVQERERSAHQALILADTDAQRRCDELGPLHGAAAIFVQDMHDPADSQRCHASPAKHFSDRVRSEGTSVIDVEVREDGTELLKSRCRALVGHEQKDGLLQLGLPCVSVKALHQANRERRWGGLELLKPGVLQASCGVGPELRILFEHLHQETSAGCRGAAREPRILSVWLLSYCSLYLQVPPVNILAGWQRPGCHEGIVACKEVVENDAEAPDIGFEGQLSAEGLRRHVKQGAAEGGGDLLVSFEELGEAEVYDFDRGGLAVREHDVLGLQVLVHEALAMHEGETS